VKEVFVKSNGDETKLFDISSRRYSKFVKYNSAINENKNNIDLPKNHGITKRKKYDNHYSSDVSRNNYITEYPNERYCNGN